MTTTTCESFFFTNMVPRSQLFGGEVHVYATSQSVNHGPPRGDDMENIRGPEQDKGGRSFIVLAERHVCHSCSASYKRVGDLVRHRSEKHGLPKYLCHIDKCPRSLPGEGFRRMHHLVAHLTSKKHGMEKTSAAYVARQFNKPKSKAREAEERGALA